MWLVSAKGRRLTFVVRVATAIVLGVAIVVVASAFASPSLQQRLDAALKSFGDGDTPTAIWMLKECVAEVPESAEAWFRLGAILHSTGDVEVAVSHYLKAIRSQPSHAPAPYLNYAIGMRKLGRHVEALPTVQSAANQFPDNYLVWNQLGLTYHYCALYPRALQAFARCLELSPDFAEGYYNKGVSHAHSGGTMEAATACTLRIGGRKALGVAGLQRNIGHPITQTTLANTDSRAIKLNPKYLEARLNLAGLYHQNDQTVEALALYKSILTSDNLEDEMRIMVLTNIGVAHQMRGRAKEAVAALEGALRLVIKRFALAESEADVSATYAAAERALRLARGKITERPSVFDKETAHEIVDLLAHLHRVRNTVADWTNHRVSTAQLVASVMDLQLHRGGIASLLPFDTLLMQVPPKFQLEVASAYSKMYVGDRFQRVGPSSLIQAETARRNFFVDRAIRESNWLGREGLHVGYLSYDFNDHPTAHMMEGLFAHHRRPSSYVEYSALSYGKNDGSIVSVRWRCLRWEG